MSHGTRILAIDDERQIRRALQVNLEAKGYEVITAETGEEALQIIRHRPPDLVLVDLLLPGMDGIELTRQLREIYQIPIIILSAIGEEAKKIEALEMGADDYVIKPFSMEELVARIRSVLRRTASIYGTDSIFTFGELQVDFDRREIRIREKSVRLTPTEYDLLKYLIHNAGKVLTHGTILRAVWGPGYVDQAQYLRVFIGNLRKKLEKNTARPQYILTDPGVGYRFATDFMENE
ncbi:MAG: response regulator transcription factor [Nitrospirota bacterium]|nr:response regulator transcription factor [Nitrospirota bacterium]MDH4361113.1 response regulator transcription factor [Nitrospirota bacterium]MDH5573988.1 response regulator transcription factor [Nitrospirota bacterium]